MLHLSGFILTRQSPTMFSILVRRAGWSTRQLLKNYQRSDAARERESQLRAAFEVYGRKAGMTRLAGIENQV